MSREFSWIVLRKRCKKMMRRKYHKTVRLTDLDMVWGDYVEYGIIRPLLKYGKAYIDKDTSLEIVGKRVVSDSRANKLASKGLTLVGGKVAKIEKVNYSRPGIIYSIKINDTSYKHGKVIFVASEKLKKRVSEHLFNSLQPYRIVA
jgi:hypothetical protein